MLPIGVVVPTRNSAALVPEHLESMREWLELVEEIVVVDSFSNDGTVEMLKAGLRHPRLQFFDHPPGLYQSWNHGISKIRAKYCYVSTVGDAITREGLQHLVDVIAPVQGDVVISKPRFIDVQGRPLTAPFWPIDDILNMLRVSEPIVLSGLPLFLFTLANYRDAILGSSASNLFRTLCLQQNPFPLEYGTAGDAGWGLSHCFNIRLAVIPRVFSTLREHPKSYSKGDYAVDQMSRKMLDRIARTYRETAAANPDLARMARELKVDRMLELLQEQLGCQELLEAYRRRPLWVLQPGAWNARRVRGIKKRELSQLKKAAVATLFPRLANSVR